MGEEIISNAAVRGGEGWQSSRSPGIDVADTRCTHLLSASVPSPDHLGAVALLQVQPHRSPPVHVYLIGALAPPTTHAPPTTYWSVQPTDMFVLAHLYRARDQQVHTQHTHPVHAAPWEGR